MWIVILLCLLMIPFCYIGVKSVSKSNQLKEQREAKKREKRFTDMSNTEHQEHYNQYIGTHYNSLTDFF